MVFPLLPGSLSVRMGFSSVAFFRFLAPFALVVFRFALAICLALLMAAFRSPFIVSTRYQEASRSRSEQISTPPSRAIYLDVSGVLLDVERAMRVDGAGQSAMAEVD